MPKEPDYRLDLFLSKSVFENEKISKLSSHMKAPSYIARTSDWSSVKLQTNAKVFQGTRLQNAYGGKVNLTIIISQQKLDANFYVNCKIF